MQSKQLHWLVADAGSSLPDVQPLLLLPCTGSHSVHDLRYGVVKRTLTHPQEDCGLGESSALEPLGSGGMGEGCCISQTASWRCVGATAWEGSL